MRANPARRCVTLADHPDPKILHPLGRYRAGKYFPESGAKSVMAQRAREHEPRPDQHHARNEKIEPADFGEKSA
jgi:hypothetical protein